MFKSEQREQKRRKAHTNATMGRRTNVLRAGAGLVQFDVTRHTKKGKGK